MSLEDIQLVRNWRNKPHVTRMFLHQEPLQVEDQRLWWKNIDPALERHFIYSLDHVDVGLVSLTKLDVISGSCEGGIFCGEEMFLRHWCHLQACLFVYSHAFDDLNFSVSTARIRSENRSAIRLNAALGYKAHAGGVEPGVGRYLLTRENFWENRVRLNRYLESVRAGQ